MNLNKYATAVGLDPKCCIRCDHCIYKWNCYDRQVEGRIYSCDGDDKIVKRNINNYLWFDIMTETPGDRQRARENLKNILECSLGN